ncbi:hypothetical protein Ahy_B03g064117 [Arachis hypogaea]|uniref:Aminotransferase-like plant mobile domain-containing protein n=1 Tax=Arachis hypogaea TaxID=3818 RepID=A0A444ZYX8_ARAHY|nr:hypothetical protein Ahy_B03g064117 [Arachis hypogaea]
MKKGVRGLVMKKGIGSYWVSGDEEGGEEVRGVGDYAALVLIGFHHFSQIGEVRGHYALGLKLTLFNILISEVTVILKDVTHILGMSVNVEPVMGRTDNSHSFFVENYIAVFGRQPNPQDHMLGMVNLAWIRQCRDTKLFTFCLLGIIVFLDKLTNSANSKFLSLLQDFHRIELTVGEVSLAHLYRSLCRAS